MISLGVNGFILVSPFNVYLTKCLEQVNAVSIVLVFFTSLCKRNILSL